MFFFQNRTCSFVCTSVVGLPAGLDSLSLCVLSTTIRWAVVCLRAAPRVQLFASAGNGWPHNALPCHLLMAISCHLRDCKALLTEHVFIVEQRYIKYRSFIHLLFTVNGRQIQNLKKEKRKRNTQNLQNTHSAGQLFTQFTNQTHYTSD